MRPSLPQHTSLLIVLLLAGLLTGCEDGFLGSGERGSGTMVTETREVADFSSIDVGSAIELDVTIDPTAAHSVVVTFDDNLIDKVVTRVSGSTLVLEIDGSVNLTGDADRGIAVTMNEMVGLEASGASDVTVTGAQSELVALEVSGASNIDVTGETTSYELNASGASNVKARDLIAADIELDVSGASSVDISATGTVRGSASGASSLDVYGDPSSVLVDSSGASSVDIKN